MSICEDKKTVLGVGGGRKEAKRGKGKQRLAANWFVSEQLKVSPQMLAL